MKREQIIESLTLIQKGINNLIELLSAKASDDLAEKSKDKTPEIMPATAINIEDYVYSKEAAKLFGCSITTIYNYAKKVPGFPQPTKLPFDYGEYRWGWKIEDIIKWNKENPLSFVQKARKAETLKREVIINLWNKQFTPQQIASAMKKDLSYVVKVIREKGKDLSHHPTQGTIEFFHPAFDVEDAPQSKTDLVRQ